MSSVTADRGALALHMSVARKLQLSLHTDKGDLDRSAHFPVDSPLCTVLRIWKEFLLAPSLSGLLSVGLSVGLVFSFCGGCGHREAKGKDFHLLPLMNFSVPLCASPHAEGRWNLHLSQL